MSEPTNYLDEETVAKMLCVSMRTIQRWRASGEGPPFCRAGARRVIYSSAAVEAWAKARTFPHLAAELSQASAPAGGHSPEAA
jgi:predicted DNA-binding transcriptional regulator AlpA